MREYKNFSEIFVLRENKKMLDSFIKYAGAFCRDFYIVGQGSPLPTTRFFEISSNFTHFNRMKHYQKY